LLGASVGYAAGITATLLLAIVLVRRGETDERPNSVSLRRFVGTAVPLAFASASIHLMNELDKVMLAIFRPESEVGIYNAAFRISRQTILLLPALNAAISPWVAPLLADGRIDDLRRLYRQTTKWSLAAGWSAGLLFVVFARDCLSLFGPAYLVGATTLMLLSAGQALNAAVGNAGVVLQFSGNERTEFRIGAWGIVANVVLNLLLIPRFGASGAAVATIASLLLIALWRILCVRQVLGCFPYDRETIHVIVGGLLAIAVAWGLRTIALALGAPVLVGLAAGVAGMAGTWIVLLRAVGIGEDEAALLKLPRGWVRRRGD
jgi:O-antigen/teichoic acid export membrane protein